MIKMSLKEKLNQFWKREIKPRFDEETLNHQVGLVDGSSVRYANLDNAATTTSFRAVVSKLEKELQEYGSVHRGAGDKSKISTKRYEEVRDTVRSFVNGKSTDYTVFAPNTTVGMNQLAYFFAHIKGKIMVSDIEHSSSWLPWIYQEGRYQTTDQVSLEDALKGKTDFINKAILDRGKKKVITYKTKEDFTFDLEDIESMLKEQAAKGEDERVKVLVVTGASNVTGYKPPLKEMADLAHKYCAMIVADCCQLLQHEKVDMQRQGLDFVVFSGHKMYAPFGSGAIVGDRRILDAFWPYQMGGGNFTYINEDGEVLKYNTNQAHDPGTPNFAGARAIHHAIRELEDIGMDRIEEYEHELVGYAFDELSQMDKVRLYVGRNADGTFDRSLMTFNIEDMPHNLVSEILNFEYGIGTRAGSYCVYEYSRRIHDVSTEEDERITREILSGKTANIPGSVRASFGMYNHTEDADRLVSAVKEIAEKGFDYYKEKYSINEQTGEWQPVGLGDPLLVSRNCPL